MGAQAAGIGARTFFTWMSRGERARRGRFWHFRQSVLQARAQARAEAERWVYEHDKVTWLLCGPGRERAGEPGWSRQVTLDQTPAEGPLQVEVHYYDPEGHEVDEKLHRIVNGRRAEPYRD